ncbi:hypothetical protein [Brevundimonas sp.]|uniref:hypothetical protein n=1 Tax=Brevundimonas sp. TaxID=1871086 RepID=UPI002D52601F|nr:hypothetical protein [Brevundimonas sp.]HYC74427.1 hypothetical protein [Brevundimonas sp.]
MAENLTEIYDDLHRSLLKRVSLWLAVGNGGGLIALGAKFTDPDAGGVAHLLFPSLWAFAIGVIAAGLFSTILAVHYGISDSTTQKIAEDERRRLIVSVGCAAVAVGCFLVGVFYPLIALTARYWSGAALV